MEQWELNLIESIASSLVHFTHCPSCSQKPATAVAADAISALSQLFTPRSTPSFSPFGTEVPPHAS